MSRIQPMVLAVRGISCLAMSQICIKPRSPALTTQAIYFI